MIMMNSFKRMIYQFDMFCSSELLRYQSDTQYKTLTGGLLSIAIISVVAVGFANMVTDTLNRVSIDSSLITQKYSDPPSTSLQPGSEGMFMMGFSVQSFNHTYQANLTSGKQYFSLQLQILNFSNGIPSNMSTINLQKCTREHWKMVPSFQAGFERYRVDSWLCLPLSTSLTLQGSFTSSIQSYIGIQAVPCNNLTSNNSCASQDQIDSLFAVYKNFYLKYYYVNPVINPNQQSYISYYVEGSDYVLFSSSMGSQSWVYFSDYSITTDDSIWPYNHQITTSGNIVGQSISTYSFSVPSDNFNKYAAVYLAKSQNSFLYTRQVQKISAVLSYIGGLVGAITAVLFLLKSYTDTSLEVSIGLNLFEINLQQMEKKPSKQNKDKRFNFLSFLCLALYRLLKFCGWKGKIQKVQCLQKCQEEAVKQMDVEFLLKRVIKLETCISKLFTPQQLKEIRQDQSITFKTAKNMRKLLFCQREGESSDGRESIQDVKNPAELLDAISDQPLKEGEGLYAQSAISFTKVKSDMIGGLFVYPQNTGGIDPSLKIEERRIVSQRTILKKMKTDEDAKSQLVYNGNFNACSKNPIVKIYNPIIV